MNLHDILSYFQESVALPVQRPRGRPVPRLISYNQFPMHYENIQAMTADLRRIKSMGFTSVWSNPLFQPCENIQQIEAEIKRGFQSAGFKDPVRIHSKPGSPYALKSWNINAKISAHVATDISEAERKALDYADINAYTQECKRLGMSPLSDFVMRHVSVDHPFVQEKPYWFKRHPNGNFVFFNRDENYRPTGQSWDDVHEFNYDDPVVLDEIVEQYLKPMSKILIQDFGFEGLRIDAAGKVPRAVYERIIPYIDELSEQCHGKPATILGETLGQNIAEFMHLGSHVDYIYNSIYFYPFVKKFWDHDDTLFSSCKGQLQDRVAPTVGFAGNHDVARVAEYYMQNQHIRGNNLRNVIRSAATDDYVRSNIIRLFMSLQEKQAFEDGQLETLLSACLEITGEQPLKGNSRISVPLQQIRKWFDAFPPSTEKGQKIYQALIDTVFSTLPDKNKTAPESSKGSLTESKLIKVLPPNYDSKTLVSKIREAFCFSAFASDGGWFFSLGDEWGVHKRTNVFTASPDDLDQRVSPEIDFSDFVCEINKILKVLPAPTNPEWAQRCFLPGGKNDDKVIAIFIHQGHGFSGTGHLVVSNVSNETQSLDLETFHQYREANGRNVGCSKDILPHGLYLCGGVALTPDLRSFLDAHNIPVHDSRAAEKLQPVLATESLPAPGL